MAEKDSDYDRCCTVCLEEYTDRPPKLLPCSHSFCVRCLEAVLEQSDSGKSLTCPQCRAQHSVPTGGPQDFITDYTIAQDIQIREWHKKVAEKKSVCGVCEHAGVTVSYCPECEAFLCSYCAGAHKRMKVFSSHQVVSSDKPAGLKLKSPPVFCIRHPTYQVSFYCSTCTQLICNECVVETETVEADLFLGSVPTSSHSRHKLYTLTPDSTKTVKNKLDAVVVRAESKQQSLQNKLKEVQEIESNHTKHIEDLKKVLKESLESYIKALKESYKKELSRIDEKRESDSEAIEEHKRDLQAKLASLKSGLRFAKKAKECSENVHKIAMMGQAMVIPDLKRLQPAPLPVHYDLTTDSLQSKMESITSELCSPPLVVNNLEATLKSTGLVHEYKSTDMHMKVCQIENQSHLHPASLLSVSNTTSCQLGTKLNVSITFSVQPVGQPKFRIVYGGSSFEKELPIATTFNSTEQAWVLTFTPCCIGEHKMHVQIYGQWITASAPKFNVTGELKEGDIVQRTPSSKSVADLFTNDSKRTLTNLKNYEVGKVTDVRKSRSRSTTYIEVVWGHETQEPKTEKVSCIWSEYRSGFPLELAITPT